MTIPPCMGRHDFYFLNLKRDKTMLNIKCMLSRNFMYIIVKWNRQAWQQLGPCHLLFGETIPPASPILANSCSEQPWEMRKCLPMGHRASLLTACCKMVGSPSSAFLSCNATLCASIYLGPSASFSWELGFREPTQTCWHSGYRFYCNNSLSSLIQ